jgi:Raf kinase inhibitor-like YbhB/YbcL family protein
MRYIMNEMVKKLIGGLAVFALLATGFFLLFTKRGQRKSTPPGSNLESVTLSPTSSGSAKMEEKGENHQMEITSSAFTEGGKIPDKYTCNGENVLPPLTIVNVPQNAKSLAIIVDDPDAPGGTWTHLLVWNISPDKLQIVEGDSLEGAIFGTNDFGDTNYGGPCPPSGTHRYFFRVYALNKVLDIPQGSSRIVFENAIRERAISQSFTMGTYTRK